MSVTCSRSAQPLSRRPPVLSHHCRRTARRMTVPTAAAGPGGGQEAAPEAPAAAASPQQQQEHHHCASTWQRRGDTAAARRKLPPEFATVEWIFGFGSLVSHPGFEYSEVVRPCYIRGYRRVFWQGSTDHRGVPASPGRTVTLEPCEGAVTWGAAYRLAGDKQQMMSTWQYLEWREKQYDQRATVQVYCPAGPPSSSSDGSSGASDGDGSGHSTGGLASVGGSSLSLSTDDEGNGVPALTALTFIATSNKAANPNYLGPAPLESIARQIATARGPSGPNYEYLFRLADALRGMGVVDEDLLHLEAKVRAQMQLLQNGAADPAAAAAVATQAAEGEEAPAA